ncbi:hypothetical protein REPUB_Repub03eG0265600 [Reevesia pubescens]
MASNYNLQISQVIDDRLEDLYSCNPYELFNIELELRFIWPLTFQTGSAIFHRSIIYPRHMILFEEYGPNSLRSLFARTGASPDLQSVIIPDILSYAWRVDRDPINLGRKIKKLFVELEVVEAAEDYEDDIDQVTDESLATFNFKPASKSSIIALKRVKLGDNEDEDRTVKKRRRLEDLSSKKQCTICLDEFFDGDEVASMPCGHVYHDDCIVKWLETSHLCPLCRYQMPS